MTELGESQDFEGSQGRKGFYGFGEFKWDRYLKYGELTDFMRKVAAQYSDLCEMYSIGKTYEGRDIWCMEITNKKTGKASEKPALYIDGNTHAGEVTGSMIALYNIWYLVSNYAVEPKITEIVDTNTFYIVPRLSADGAELYLTEPYIPRSSIRPWPYEEDQDGLYPYDVNGDGFIVQMRVQDENGEWRVSEKDSRVMVRRKPNEVGGKYYTVLPEGMIRNYNGFEVKSAPSKWGLDMNRNYGAKWQQQHVQPGAGPYPFSEPESRSVAEFFEAHKNICLAQSYHTFTGAILRPPASGTEKDMNPIDLKAHKEIGEVGTEVTGYPCLGVFDDFQLSKDFTAKRPLWGSALEWMYDHEGVVAYSTEVWDMPNRAMGRNDTYKTLMDWSEDEQIQMQKWNDENLNGDGFVNWHYFEHPQLGPVEIGGWKHKFVFQNPPPQFLEQECRKNTLFAVEAAMTLPKVKITKVEVEKSSKDLFTVKIGVRNMGYLPTNVTEQAKKNHMAQEVNVEIILPEGAKVVGGREKVTVSHLEGRLTLGRAFSGARQLQRLCQWAVKLEEQNEGAGPVSVRVRAGCPRGGYDEKEIELS